MRNKLSFSLFSTVPRAKVVPSGGVDDGRRLVEAVVDINRSHASSAPSEPPSPSEEPHNPAPGAQSDAATATATQAPRGALASLAGRRRSRSPEAQQASEPAEPSSGAQPPRKKLRTAQGVRFAEPAHDGAAGASGSSSSQPMARLRAMPRHEADDPQQRSINEQIARNQRALLERLHIERQPVAAFMRQDWFLAEAGVHLPPSDQLGLLTDVLHVSEEARAEFARLLPAGYGGAYLSRDEQALAHSLGGGTPDAIVRRASWLMRAGLTGRLFPGAAPSALLSRTVEQAEAELRAHFEHGGPHSQANAVNDLVGAVLFAPTLEDGHRLAQLVLQPHYFRAMPEGWRANTLWMLTNSLLSVNSRAWIDLSSSEPHPAQGDAPAPAVNADVARIAELGVLHRTSLGETIPPLLDAVRATPSMPSHVAQGILFCLAQLAGRGMPNAAAQRGLLDLYERLLPHVSGADRDQAYTGLAAMIWALGEPGLQRRAFNLLTQHRPGTARTSDWLAHLDVTARSGVLLSMVFQLRTLGDDLRAEAFALLSDQTAPGIVERLPPDARRRLLEQTRELEAQPGDNLRLLGIVDRLLEHAPVDDIDESLRVLFGHADAAPQDEALEHAVLAMWDRFLPQLPADRSGHLLAHAVAVDVGHLPLALHRFASVDANRLYAMLAALNDARSQPLANELVERGIEDPDALRATLQAVLADRPEAQRAAAASSVAHVLFWAAWAMPEAQRPQALGNFVRDATRIISDTPMQARPAVLAAFLRPEPAGRVGGVAYRYLAGGMQTLGAQRFHRWLDTVPVSDRLSMATGVARLLPTIRVQAAAATAVTMVEGLYPRSLGSWNDHHALVLALTGTLAHWPAIFDVERMRVGAMIEHGLRALPPGTAHEQALGRLATIARDLPQGASSSREAAPGTHAWAMQLIHSELARTGDATRARVSSLMGPTGGDDSGDNRGA